MHLIERIFIPLISFLLNYHIVVHKHSFQIVSVKGMTRKVLTVNELNVIFIV